MTITSQQVKVYMSKRTTQLETNHPAAGHCCRGGNFAIGSPVKH